MATKELKKRVLILDSNFEAEIVEDEVALTIRDHDTDPPTEIVIQFEDLAEINNWLSPHTKENRCIIKEQTVKDELSGLTLQFRRHDNGGCTISIKGQLIPHGNRDIAFDSSGIESGRGTYLGKAPTNQR